MIAPRLIPTVLRQVLRHRTRTLLTAAGVAVAMFLFVTVQSLQQGVRAATEVTAADTTLIVYRENRFCPATSRLPEHYAERIARLPGVASVTPMKVVVNNCRASLDVVTFRGVPAEDVAPMAAKWRIVAGSLEEWHRRSDSALIGERMAERRRLRPGMSFDASGVTVSIAGIIASSEPQDQNVAYVHLPFLQQAAATGPGLGVVTQFNVRVDDPAHLREIAAQIDELFRHDQDPTTTRPEKAFVAQVGADVVEIVGFARYLGWGCLAAVLALVANAIVLGVQDRVKEHAVLQTLGFRGGLIARMIIAEGLVLGLLGGAAGTAMAAAFLAWGKFSLSTEGLSIHVSPDVRTSMIGLAIAAGVGVAAGLVPAAQAGRREIAQSFRAV
ncbi:MAG: ABC transporter permease [Phycisphaeraceae bacterium]|nr:ABC transporter permease [Phycisphaeraceae bacterium]MBX3406952.1 ABC transporter permease [Phycisphaeraceae bacterium]